jgi:hypothetical protein
MRHILRIVLITVALALIGLALTPKATPAQSTNPCDASRPIPYGWHLRPAEPSGGDSVIVVFTSCRDCVDLLDFEMSGSGQARLDLRMRDVCPMTLLCRRDSLEVPLGRLASGRHRLTYGVHAAVVYGDSAFCYVERPDTVDFVVGGTVTPPPPLPVLPYTSVIKIGPAPPCADCPPRICPDEPIPFLIAGSFPSGCYHFRSLELLPSPIMVPGPQPPVVRIHIDRRTCAMCTLNLPPWAADTVLAGLPPGTYGLMLQMVVTSYCDSLAPDSTTYYANRTFTVKDSCLAGPLPFGTRVRIGPPPPCANCPPQICPAAPIPVVVAGMLPSSCYQFRKLELLPSPIVGPRQEPPVVRIVVAENDCMDWPCLNVQVPWQARTLLPGLPSGAYGLMMQLDVVSMCDSTRVNATYRATESFAVRDSCVAPPTEPCLMTDWVHSGLACDDFIAPGGVAKSVMTAMSPTPLAGLQGRLSLYPRGLRISHLEPVGAAQGMHIAWVPKENGAEFVLFAEAGAPIGGVRCETGARCQQPVLAVSMVPDTDAVLPPVTHLSVGDLLGSDSLGNAVPACPIVTLVAVESRICAGPSCDFNLDGRLDVRDLVSMVRCVRGTGACPDTSLARLDCNGDGRTNVDDVMCCARTILHGGERDTMPGRPEPNVAIELGEPQWESDGLLVPIRVHAADRVGALRLALALPLDRYDVTSVETGAGAGQWLELHEVTDGRLVLGLIGLDPEVPAEEPLTLDLALRLALKPGQGAGGDVGLADLQLSGRDGVTLEVTALPVPVPLPAPGALLLSAARPNPFTHETSFALNLDRAADVDLTVHDLSGRRVATLFRGALGAGPHEFAWRGARSDGSAAANGIYFLQARVGGERLTRKVIFLRGN